MADRLLVLRHGETDWNVQRRWQGQSGPGLNATGRAQAALVAARLRDDLLDDDVLGVVSSDLVRAAQTARLVADALDVGLDLDPRLREIDVGRWVGRTRAQIAAGDRDPWSGDPSRAFGGVGESVDDLRARAAGWIADVEPGTGGTLVVVSHGGWLRALTAEVLRMPRPDLLGGGANTSITELAWSSRHGVWRLAGYGDAAHLRDAHPELAVISDGAA